MHTIAFLIVTITCAPPTDATAEPTDKQRLEEIATRVDRHYGEANRYALRVDTTSIHYGFLTRKRFEITSRVEAEPDRLRARHDLVDGPFLAEIIQGRQVDASVFRDGRWQRRNYRLGAADSAPVLDFLFRDREVYYCLLGCSDNLMSPGSIIRRGWVQDIRRGRWLGRKELDGEYCDMIECERREVSRRETYFVAADGAMRQSQTRIFRLWNSVPSIDVIHRYVPLERPFGSIWDLATLERLPTPEAVVSRNR